MPCDRSPREVVVCLGSSCFARGNSQYLETIEAYLKNRGLGDAVRITGSLCRDECKLGPNLVVCGEDRHEVTAAKLREILQQLSAEAR
ncbi:MAG: (2Fe-2S) ferredoxin domain-containing protein [Terracidiphilus sp.]